MSLTRVIPSNHRAPTKLQETVASFLCLVYLLSLSRIVVYLTTLVNLPVFIGIFDVLSSDE